jgi:hypothetical protein
VLDDDAHTDLGLDFGLGHDLDHDTFGSGHGDSGHHDLTHLALDLGDHLGLGDDDLDTSTFDQGFGNGAHDVDVDHLHDVDDLHAVDPHHDTHHDFGHGPH